MAQKIGLKSAGKEDISKLLTLTADDIENSSADELVGMLALANDRLKDISIESDSLMESSGLNELDNETTQLKAFVLRLSRALILSGYLRDANGKVYVNIHSDEVVSVQDGDESRYETEDVIKSSSSLEEKVSYSVAPNVPLENLLNKLADGGIIGSVRLGSMPLTGVTITEFKEIKDYLKRFGLLGAFSINKAAFNSDMHDYATNRQELIDVGMVIADSTVKISKATSRQLSLLDDEDEIAVDLCGGIDNEQEA